MIAPLSPNVETPSVTVNQYVSDNLIYKLVHVTKIWYVKVQSVYMQH